jgi:hypothetical protein
MNDHLETIRKTRAFMLSLVSDLTLEELNAIPTGFNNNIIWNLGHVVAAQQGVCYARAGLPTWVDEAFFSTYKPGSKPEAAVDNEAVENIKSLMSSSLDKLQADYESGVWKQYPAWTTRYGTELSSIEDAVAFLLFHEGLHVGYIMALKRVVKR